MVVSPASAASKQGWHSSLPSSRRRRLSMVGSLQAAQSKEASTRAGGGTSIWTSLTS